MDLSTQRTLLDQNHKSFSTPSLEFTGEIPLKLLFSFVGKFFGSMEQLGESNVSVDRNVLFHPKYEGESELLSTAILLQNEPKNEDSEVLVTYWDRWYVDSFEPSTVTSHPLGCVKVMFPNHHILLLEYIIGILLPIVNINKLGGLRDHPRKNMIV